MARKIETMKWNTKKNLVKQMTENNNIEITTTTTTTTTIKTKLIK